MAVVDISILTQRITCSIVNRRNDYGKPKLIATIDHEGLWVWCRYCKDKHYIKKEDCIEAWARGESVITCGGGE